MAQVCPNVHHRRLHHQNLHHHHHHQDCEQGELGKLGNPGKVLGVDISDGMISHCSENYNGQQNLSFQVQTVFFTFGMGWKGSFDGIAKSDPISLKTLDVSNGAEFCQSKESSFDMVSQPYQFSLICSNSLMLLNKFSNFLMLLTCSPR